MDYQQAIDVYARALRDIATILQSHREAQTDFEADFLARTLQDGFLQAATEQDRLRVVSDHAPGESFLLWPGELLQPKMTWNCVCWIFPFQTIEEMERAYELITRAELAQKPWASVRQFWLSCRMRMSETPFRIPTNFVRVRVKGEDCRAALKVLQESPPNLRYVTKTVLDRLPATHYFRKRTHVKLVVGEQLQPYVRKPR